MSMFLFLIVVVSLACGSAAPQHVPLIPCLTASAALALAWGWIAQTAVRLAVARVRSGVQPLVAMQRLQRQLEALRWLSPVAVLICLLGCNLAGAVQTWPVFAPSMFLQAIVLLTPGLILIACTLWAEHRYRVATGQAAAGFLVALGQTVASLMRLAGWLIAPILAILAALDLLTLLPWTDQLPTGIGLTVLTLLTAPVLVPWMAKHLWPTRPLDSAEHHWIRDLVASAGMSRLDLRLWNTGMRTSNAVVVGFFPGLRSLLLTDRLLRDLPAEQLKLIVLHEIAHIRRSHIWLRILSVIPGGLLAAGILHIYGTGPSQLLLSHAAAITMTLVMLRFSAHETEFDADRAACELAMQIAGPASLPRVAEGEASPKRPAERPSAPGQVCSTDARTAANGLAGALRRVTCDQGGSHGASWLHPSVDSRCRRLQRWADNVMQ